MSCRTETKTIDDHEYSVTQWGAEKAILMKFKLIEAFGPAILLVARVNESEDWADIADGLSEVFKTSSPDVLTQMLKECVVGVAKDGKRITTGEYAQLGPDDIMLIYKIFLFVVQVNYSALMPGQFTVDALAKMKANLLTKVGSPASTDSSTDPR